MILDRVSSGLNGSALLSGMALALANMVPIIGAIMWEWGPFEILSIYWAELLIIGALNIPRMILAKKRPADGPEIGNKVINIPLFVIIYGLFCCVQAFFVFVLNTETEFQNPITAAPILLVTVLKTSVWAVLILFLGHLFSFFWNYIGQREYRQTMMEERVYQPFSRVVVLHIIVLFGAYTVSLLGASTVSLLVLVAAKTTFDLGFHFYAHAAKEEFEPLPT